MLKPDGLSLSSSSSAKKQKIHLAARQTLFDRFVKEDQMTKSASPDPWMLAHLMPTSQAPPVKPFSCCGASPQTREILLAF